MIFGRYAMTVHESKRNESELEFYDNAVELRIAVLRLMRSPDVVPKSSRFMLALPTADAARSMLNNIVRGMEFFPNSEANVEARKRYYTLAIADCRIIQEDIKCMKRLLGNVRASAFEEVTAMIAREIDLLKRQRKNVRVRGQEQ